VFGIAIGSEARYPKNKLFDILLKKILIECLLFSANAAIFQQYHGEKKLIVNEMMMRSTLYHTNTSESWILTALAH
jgi:hypothetical protein